MTVLGWSFNTNTNKNRLKVLNDEKRRLKDYFLLGGKIFKWLHLYQELPPNDSWVWGWYPDGERWRLAADKHGHRVHEAIIEEIL